MLILLEGSTCSRFRDALLDLPMNSDEIFFIATANRLETIPNEILSRFTIMEIKKPSPGQMKKIIKNIYSDVISTWWIEADYECKEINNEIFDLLKNQSVRDVKRLISEAVNRSAYANHNTNKKIIHIDRKSLFGNDFFDDILHDLDFLDYTMQ